MISVVATSSWSLMWMPVLLAAVLQVIVVIKRLFSPLSRVPGPFITKISYVPIFAYDQRSKRTAWIRRLHDKYGPVVRVSPTEISVASATGIRDIFAGSSSSGGPYPKSKTFELFKHFGARNSFTSITSAQHGWRRKVIGASYSQSAVLAREAATGNIWRTAGNYIHYIGRAGMPAGGNSIAKSVDIHTANTFFAGDSVSSYVLLDGLQALLGNEKHQRLIVNTQEKPGDVLSYFHQEYREFFNWLNAIKIFVRAWVPGLGPQVLSERTRVGDKDPKKLNSVWYGGTEYRDFTYKSYLDAKSELKSNPQSLARGPITLKLANNVITGEQIQTSRNPVVEDPSMRGFESEGNFHKDAGAASEAMDHLIAGQDTTSETLSHAFQALSMLQNKPIQDKLRAEIATLNLPTEHDQPLQSEQLSHLMRAPYLDAVIKETLRLYPPHTTNIQRTVPAGGRVLDGLYLTGGAKVGTSAYVVHMNREVFGPDVESWKPERWLLEDKDQVRQMEQTLWAFGSGTRGCVGKHLAMVEMKILLSSLYGRYTTIPDQQREVPLESNHFKFRSTNRDYSYFPNAGGRIVFAEDI
ncbi:hypothetical protein A1O1_06657 [Capronia coronata CBS 617.96]|uniref:Cytochrome P450 oxidoreductase n=1 Tax=Capronia coronata CBS 617.96 TaxID=1182541 RepID=W9Y0E9_9EURO|nr:uncharacterized protein A1O1_06657 [Capronia coronata CBS 617.96]EXJ86287.1 hypothetical protein A1O1_06657 [Capronia coronata CBS 617.96]